MKTKQTSALPEKTGYTKYFEHDGALRAYANRMMWFHHTLMVYGVGSEGRPTTMASRTEGGNSTQHYLDITPTKLAQSFRNAGYFARNVRAIDVLIDREVVISGKAAEEPWKFYDLGHGYCAYDFFDQCPHRMACAKCGFYAAKDSSRAQLLEGKANLLRMRQEIPLNEAELAAVDDGVPALQKLLDQLADVATPAGPTPRQLRASVLVQIAAAEPDKDS